MAELRKEIDELKAERAALVLLRNAQPDRDAICTAIASIEQRLAVFTAQQGKYPPPVSVVVPHSSR